MGLDRAVLLRSIPTTSWDLVFTAAGRYFFFDNEAKLADWVPPESLRERLLALPEHALEALFDPDCDEDALASLLGACGEEAVEYEEPTEGEQSQYDMDEPVEESQSEQAESQDEDAAPGPVQPHRPHVDPALAAAQQQQNASAFMNMLRERNVDPFRPWDQIAQELQKEGAFRAVPSARERVALFAALSPELAERVRASRKQGLAEATEAWAALLASFTDAARLPATWTEFSKHLRRSAAWYKLLDGKEMEKQYRARLKELRDRAVTYNVRSNK